MKIGELIERLHDLEGAFGSDADVFIHDYEYSRNEEIEIRQEKRDDGADCVVLHGVPIDGYPHGCESS